LTSTKGGSTNDISSTNVRSHGVVTLVASNGPGVGEEVGASGEGRGTVQGAGLDG
jgi:hypothetical protein